MSDGNLLPRHVCYMSYEGYTPSVCGTDNVGYKDFRMLECAKLKVEGKRINLQLKHEGNCLIWERYGFETSTVIIVSKLRIDSQTNSTLHLNSLCMYIPIFFYSSCTVNLLCGWLVIYGYMLCLCILVLYPCFCSTTMKILTIQVNWLRKSIYNDCLNFIADFCIYCIASCSSCWCVLVPALFKSIEARNSEKWQTGFKCCASINQTRTKQNYWIYFILHIFCIYSPVTFLIHGLKSGI